MASARIIFDDFFEARSEAAAFAAFPVWVLHDIQRSRGQTHPNDRYGHGAFVIDNESLIVIGGKTG